MEAEKKIINPKRRIVDDLKIRNKDNMDIIAGEYFGSKFTYAETFKMFEDYKKAFIALDGKSESPITISAPSTISSVNAMYGALDANKIINMTGPGFLFSYTDKYTKEIGSKTVVIFDSFLNEEFINRLHKAGVKNVIIASVTDYMNPAVKQYAIANGAISGVDFLDAYSKEHQLPLDMQFIRISEFAETGAKITETVDFPYEENKIAAYFLTGATTSVYPKGVKLYADGFNNMAEIYKNLWFDFQPGIRQTIFIPMFYATGAIHGVHAGLFSGMTLCYKPKYDRFAFAGDLSETKCEICIVAPSHVATLESAGLPDNSLSHLKYLFIGGEAIMPAQMEKFHKTAKRLGIQHILNGYGMTETGSMSGMSDKIPDADNDVSVAPVPGVRYRIVDTKAGQVVPDGSRGVLEKQSPCATAGYLDKEKDKTLFTKDAWIHTGDIAERLPNGKYRIYGRVTDCFENGGKTFAMYDIEEKVLEHPAVSEAEVVKYKVGDNEYPGIFAVLNAEYAGKQADVLKDLCNLNVAGMEHLIGVKFIDKFKTNPVTSKRDYLSLNNEKDGFIIIKDGKTFEAVVSGDKVDYRALEQQAEEK